MTINGSRHAAHQAIDMRTDTCTHPTPEMYEAMATAPLGDDGWRDDPTALELESVAAALLGKEAALFLPSGTMSDLVALMSHGPRGGELIAHADAWVIGRSSHGGYATIAGLAARPVPGPRGAMNVDMLAELIDPIGSQRSPYTALVAMENTHTRSSGAVLPVAHMAAVYALASAKGVPVFLDGARLLHAAVASNTSMAALARHSDSVSLSLCKALGAPAGSILAGSKAFIDRALIFRKLLGGTMRQTGLLAACALVALRAPLDAIGAYHRRAKALARGLHNLDPTLIDPDAVETNLLTLDLRHTGMKAAGWIKALAEHGVLVAPAGLNGLRLLTHSEITDGAVAEALAAFAKIRADCPDGTPLEHLIVQV